MAAWDIKGRDAFSATSGTGQIDFAPINIGALAGAGASASTGSLGGSGLSPLVMVGLAVLLVAGIVLMRHR